MLTGEMIVHFAESLPEAEAREWGERQGAELVRDLHLDNAYLYRCPPGPACLSESVAAGLPITHSYGFGRVDADAAVMAAPTWPLVGPEVNDIATGMPKLPIADGTGAASCGAWTTDTLTIDEIINIESVEVGFTSNHI